MEAPEELRIFTEAGTQDVLPIPLQANASRTADPKVEYVNYLDIKVERIENMPLDWFDLADAPGYHQHPFRYEVAISTPLGVPVPEEAEKRVEKDLRSSSVQRSKSGQTSIKDTPPPPPEDSAQRPLVNWMTFTHGRLLQNLPQYQRYVESAIPQPIPGMDEVIPIRDVPESLDIPVFTDTAASRPDRRVSLTATGSATLTGDAPEAPPPVILWVTNAETDVSVVPTDDTVQKKGKRRAMEKNPVVEVPPPPNTPDKDEPPPCVLRIPLDIEQEAYLENLLNLGQPLNLMFRRILRSGLPPEWEDLNAAYFEAVIPVNIFAFAEPGSLELTCITSLEPKPLHPSAYTENLAKKKPRRAKLGQPLTLIEEPDMSAEHPYHVHHTTAVVSLRLQRTLARLASDRVRPNITPAQLIPKRQQMELIHLPPNATRDFNEAIEVIARKIIRDYKEMSGDSLLNASATREEKEAWRSRFLDFFQSIGQLEAYKSQITPLVVRVAREKFLRGTTRTPEVISELSNELYVYLLDCMHATLIRVMNQEAHLSPTESPEKKEKANDHTPSSDSAEVSSSIWAFRALEAEMSNELSLAAKYHQATLFSFDDPCSLTRVWTNAAEFFVRAGDPSKAEQCYREALSTSLHFLPALLGYGMWLMSYHRINEAAVYLHSVVDLSPTYALAWGCIALLDDMFLLSLKMGSPQYSSELAKWQKEQRYALLKAAQCFEKEDNSPTAKTFESNSITGHTERPSTQSAVPPANEEAESSKVPEGINIAREGKDGRTSNEIDESEEDRVYLTVADYAIHLHHRDLANLCLARCRVGRVEVQRAYARLFVQCDQYAEAQKMLDSLAVCIPSNYDSLPTEEKILVDEYLIMRAKCEAGQGRTEEAIFFYKEALCKNLTSTPSYIEGLECVDVLSPLIAKELPQTRSFDGAPRNRRYFFSKAYLELGNLLLREGKVRDALGVFTLGIECWNCGLMWLGAGIAYFRMGEYEAAEECLNESNIRNPLNPRTWGYLCLLCIRTRREEVEEIVQRVMIQGLTDPFLWAELGRELLNANHPQLSEVCLRKALVFEGSDGSFARSKGMLSPLAATTKYHLSHTLGSMQRWDEARKVMEEVITGTENEVLRGKAEEDLKAMNDGRQ